MPDQEAASEFLETLNKCYPSIDFTMDLEENGRIPFLGIDVIRNGCRVETTVYTTTVTLTPDTTVTTEHHAKPCISTLVYVEVFSRGM